MLIMPSFKKSLIVEQFQGNYLNRIHVWFKIGNITHNLPVPVYRQTDFTPKRVVISRLHDSVARFRTGVKFSPRYKNRGELTPRSDSRRHDILGAFDWEIHLNPDFPIEREIRKRISPPRNPSIGWISIKKSKSGFHGFPFYRSIGKSDTILVNSGPLFAKYACACQTAVLKDSFSNPFSDFPIER